MTIGSWKLNNSNCILSYKLLNVIAHILNLPAILKQWNLNFHEEIEKESFWHIQNLNVQIAQTKNEIIWGKKKYEINLRFLFLTNFNKLATLGLLNVS